MNEYDKNLNLQSLSRVLGLIIGTTGIVIGFWDKMIATYLVVLGLWLCLVLGSKD